MARQTRSVPHASTKKLLRIGGLPAVSALFAVAPERVEQLFFDHRMKPHVDDLCAKLARMRRPYRQVGSDELDRVAGTMLHGGVVALARPRSVSSLDPLMAKAWAADGQLLLLLDGVGNPHNLGAIARTAAFFGVPRIVLSDHPAQAGPSDASYRVAEGGLEYVELYRGFRFTQVLRDLRESYRIVGAATDKGRPVAALSRSKRPFALILGNEERGLPRATIEACDEIVTIPGCGLIQSLNVAATAAILLHAFTAAHGSGT
ncbi:MAG TPA: RNA methyltransferase [Burkholderiaceae bacterium]|nr:RNA methyltransferase [Burkholderiaceae bacterium]